MIEFGATTGALAQQDGLLELWRRHAILLDVREGLSRPQKELPPKYFYDQRGSRLFEEITRLPEYYLTRAEREILVAHAGEIAAATHARSLVELGAGSAAKTRLLLDAMHARRRAMTYVPIDVSADFLDATASALRQEYPELHVERVIGDMTDPLELPRRLSQPVLIALLGSTIGNFDTASAIALLQRARAAMHEEDRFLLGADLRKDVDVLVRAYDDARGVTAAFNRNILHVLNAELGADFVPGCFAHRAVYDPTEHRIEMHLVARRRQDVRIPDLPPVSLAAGETIRTEISCKYDRATIEAMSAASGFRVDRWLTDAESRFAVTLLEPIP
jgi:L-histidine N-alpha-methyltransferase